MSELKPYVIALHKYEDLQAFYDDMETPGGNLYIPDRAIGVDDRREISRSTHYLLTQAEANEIAKDPRVLAVEDLTMVPPPETHEYDEMNAPEPEIDPHGTGSTSLSDFYSKWQSWYARSLNWGMVEHSYANPNSISSWGASDVYNPADPSRAVYPNEAPVSYIGTGRNVDVVIWDGGTVVTDHPEFAVNRDGTGGSRVVEYNWLTSVGGTYTYPDKINYHATHVAGTAAGGRYGWAYDANIYSIDYNLANGLDYIRYFHANKAVNPETGRKNPTIVNMSWGSGFRMGADQAVEYAQYGFYRGNGVVPSTRAEYLDQIHMHHESGTTDSDAVYYMPFWSDAGNADFQDAMNEGIIFVSSAGNSKNYLANYLDSDWNNYVYARYNGNDSVFRVHRGGNPKYPGVIVVGALDVTRNPRQADFSTRGVDVDIYAAGVSVVSSYTSNGAVNDVRNSSYKIANLQGTSMAAPQVAGVLACLLEQWPNLTQSEAMQWIKNNSRNNAMRDYGYVSSDANSTYALAGANNAILYYKPTRDTTGNSFPEKRYKTREASGVVYPRTKIRRRG